jgi:phage terminase small subunit
MPDNLTLKQRRAVTALLTQPDTTAAARSAGASRDTLYRWLAEPAFQAALRDAEADALAAVSRRLVRLADAAATTLETAMRDEATPAATRVRAADAVLSRLLQLRELVTLEERVRELEARYAEQERRSGR